MVQCKLLSNKKTPTKHCVISEVLSPVLIIDQVPMTNKLVNLVDMYTFSYPFQGNELRTP